jgi:hypothetical protein
MVLSSEAVSSVSESAENCTVRTDEVCALNTVTSPLLRQTSPYTLGVHKRTVLSLDEDASTFPDDAKSRLVTAPLIKRQYFVTYKSESS